MNIAKPLGVAQDALGRIVLTSLDNAADSAARSGRWDALAATRQKQYWNAQDPASLIAQASQWFLQ
jgi:hypothetical protein